jgi:hypothetical protein
LFEQVDDRLPIDCGGNVAAAVVDFHTAFAKCIHDIADL